MLIMLKDRIDFSNGKERREWSSFLLQFFVLKSDRDVNVRILYIRYPELLFLYKHHVAF